jgi:hypothetical protein
VGGPCHGESRGRDRVRHRDRRRIGHRGCPFDRAGLDRGDRPACEHDDSGARRELGHERRRSEPRQPRRRIGHPADRPGDRFADRDEWRDASEGSGHRPQPCPKLAPGAEEKRLDRRLRDRERTCELPVREAGELAQEERLPLPSGQLGDRLPERDEVGARCGSGDRIRQGALRLCVTEGFAHALLDAFAALVARDRREPGRRVAWLDPVQEAAIRGEEGLLDCVLRLFTVAREQTAEPEHRRPMPGEELG